jgi:hypothetical protein
VYVTAYTIILNYQFFIIYNYASMNKTIRFKNSSTESYNRSMRKNITVMLDKNPTMDWEDLLPSMTLSYNCHVHRATGDSPFFLTFAQDPRLPYFDIEKPRMFYNSSYV